MDLSPQQAATLLAYIDSVPEMAAAPLNSDGAYLVAALLNLDAAPAFVVWRSDVPIDQLHDAVKWASLTPVDAVPSSDAVAVAVWQARSLACQGKQFNLQMILQKPGGIIDASRSGIRTGLQDALTGLPSGVGGATVDAGWTGAGGVRLTLQRNASAFEKLFAAGTGTSGSPATMVLEGPIDGDTIAQVRGT